MTIQVTLDDILSAARIVYTHMQATPQYRWPMLCERLGTEVWVKHENHTPVGAFKIRGGLVYFNHLAQSDRLPMGVITATRGNHGQSVGYAAGLYDIPVTIVVPHGNSVEKNAAMRALGVELIEYGDDFQASREFAEKLAHERSLEFVPSFHPLLIAGVATYSLELLRHVEDIDVVYVPIGLGSGICGMLAARDALKLNTEVVGVVSAHAPAYAKSFEAGYPIEAPVTTHISDGMACRTAEPEALGLILKGVDRIVQVTDAEVAAAMCMMFECTHNVCEGAGAAALAAARQEKSRLAGRRVAVVASGGNVDQELFAEVLKSGR
jgi:threonine dehydratase